MRFFQENSAEKYWAEIRRPYFFCIPNTLIKIELPYE